MGDLLDTRGAETTTGSEVGDRRSTRSAGTSGSGSECAVHTGRQGGHRASGCLARMPVQRPFDGYVLEVIYLLSAAVREMLEHCRGLNEDDGPRPDDRVVNEKWSNRRGTADPAPLP